MDSGDHPALASGPVSSLGEIAEVMRGRRRFLVAGHVRPDGDALGSSLAVGEALAAVGCEVVVVNEDGVPGNLAFLPGIGRLVGPEAIGPFRPEVMIAVDTANRERLGEGVLAAAASADTWINLDHHVSNPGYGDLNHVDPSAPATGQIVYELLSEHGFPVTAAAVDQLFVAISTDTGSFQYPGTTARTYRVVADLVEAGAEVGRLSQLMYESHPFRRIALMRELLARLRLEADGRLVSVSLSSELASSLGLEPGDTEGIIDLIRAIDSVVVAVFFEELEDGRVRVSSRSKSRAVDVCRLCRAFGGGGHPLAAGARLPGPLAEAEQRFLQAATEAIHHGQATPEAGK